MSSSLESSIMRIWSANGVVVGAGFLVGERHVLTCAHVVAGALGLANNTPEKPQTPVSLDVPRVAPRQLLTARVVLWRPPRADGGDDIAGLGLDGDPPHGAQAAPLAQVEDLWKHSFGAFGFPRGQDTGVWATGRLLGRQATNWVQIEEELFTQTLSEDERRHFLDLLFTSITEPHGPVIVLLTLRADFSDRPLAYPTLGQLIDHHHQLVFPMKLDELRATIEQPVALPDVRLTFEGDLVGDLLFEVQGQVGALPLLQFTLDQLFRRRSGRQLTLSAYREIGGVKGALTRQAEETYTKLPSDEHRKLACALFVRLIDPGATEQDTTRRRAALSEFTLADATQNRLMRETIDAFIAARLLTTNEIAGTTTIEVSHEALIREWPRLAGWLREAREDILLQ